MRIELINLQTGGWAQKRPKEILVACCEIRLCDLGKSPFDESGWVQLPLPEISDYRKLGLTHSGMVINGTPVIEIQIFDMTRFDAATVHNPNRNIIEDRPVIFDYNVNHTKTVLLRTKLGISMLNAVKKSDGFIFHYYYPRYSYLCWGLGHAALFFFDP